MPTGHGPSEGLGASCRVCKASRHRGPCLPSTHAPDYHKEESMARATSAFQPLPYADPLADTERFCPDFAEGEMGRIGLTTRLKNPAESKSHRAKRVASPEE